MVSGMPRFAAEGPFDGDVGSLASGTHVGEQSGSEISMDFSDLSDEGGAGGDSDCQDTHPNADSNSPSFSTAAVQLA